MSVSRSRFAVGAVLLGAVSLVQLAGCGPSAPFDIVPATGQVTYDDGTPIPGHMVFAEFHSQSPPKSAKEFPKMGRADVDPDGKIKSSTTWKFNDGLIVGTHKVVVRSLDEKQSPTKAVPTEYTSPKTTPLTVEIKAGGPPLDIKVPKPTK